MVSSVRGPRWWLAALWLLSSPLFAETAGLKALAAAGDWQKIQAFGPRVLPEPPRRRVDEWTALLLPTLTDSGVSA
jgi:hypothetical protein